MRGHPGLLQLAGFIASIAFVAVVKGQDTLQASESADQINIREGCKPNGDNEFITLVSTLDGKLSALNVQENGKLEWSIDVGSSPLLSSSISKLEIRKNGLPVRLVPSLDGSLYEYNGETVEALPFTADSLLSSSFKFNEDFVIVGGKETLRYGINSKTGRLIYQCGVDGCTRYDQEETRNSSDDLVLVVSRNTKTVRAVDSRSGAEKWNFSVGEHEISLVKSEPISSQQRISTVEAPNSGVPVADDSVYVSDCPDAQTDETFGFPWLFGETQDEVDVKVLVPNGMVFGMSRNDPGVIVWKHQFPAPIAGIWHLRQEELSRVSIFNDHNVPALTESAGEDGHFQQFPQEPLLYVGTHQGQTYVQPSRSFAEEIASTLEDMGSPGNTAYNALDMPRVRWNPYLATSMTRTPLLTYRRHPLRITSEDPNEEVKLDDENDPLDDESTLQILDQYPFDGGYYLYPDTSRLQENSTEEDFYFASDITVTLWNWWKEVVMITVVTTVLVHVLTIQLMKKWEQRKSREIATSQVSTDTSNSESIPSPVEKKPSTESSASLQNNMDYISRFFNEFEQKACLGRGGFGVVFESRNKMDDCSYAIKRITLNDSERAREKVMREVKALAKLDHSGIVRYYQAWFENPPAGWQEEKDRNNKDMMTSCTPTPVYSSDGPQSHSFTPTKNKSVKAGDSSLRDQVDPFDKCGNIFDPLRPFGGCIECSFESKSEGNKSQKKGSSGGFVPSPLFPDVNESFSMGISKENANSDYVSVEFRNSNSESNWDQTTSRSANLSQVPFNRYDKNSSGCVRFDVGDTTNDSLDIVFEDSGCAEKNSDDLFFDNMEEASGHNGIIEQTTWMESEGIRNRRDHKSKTPTLISDGGDASSEWHVSAENVSSQKRPSTLDLDVVAKRRKDSPVPKLYLYIQMQLCRRESLKDWLNDNTLNRDRKQLLDIFDQILCAVDYIHEHGLMHRDLKPSNIFFSMDGLVKVGDFGLVTASEEQCLDDVAINDRRCGIHRHTDQVGTKMYMSPEQAEAKGYSNKVDIFSLGLIFFELYYPFDTQMERIKTLLDVRKGNFPSRFQRELSLEHGLIQKMLHEDPEERPSTKDIFKHPLLKDFEMIRQAVVRTRSSQRTISTGSSSSGSNSEGLSP